MPSSNKAYQAIIKLIDNADTGAIIDLGSGWGNLVIQIAKNNPERQVIGYELSLLPLLISILTKRVLGLENLTLYRQNFYNVKLPDASTLICYLYPEAMKKIKQKLLLEQPRINFIISNNFALPSWQANKVVTLNDFYQSPIYLYKISNSI